MKIKGVISGMAIHYAHCCHPLPGERIVGIVTTGNVVQFSIPTNDFPSFARVTQVNTNSIQVSGVTTITAYREGGLPTVATEVTDFSVVQSSLQKGPKSSTSKNRD